MSKLVKLEIRPYSDPKFKSSAGEVFKAQFNPAEIDMDWAINAGGKLKDITLTGNKKFSVKITDTQSVTSKFKLIFDNTMSKDKTPIVKKVGDFRKTCLKVNPQVHAPNYVRLVWGEFAMSCQLISLSVKFTLFSPEGIPLRAELNCGFRRFVDYEMKLKEEDNKSPDMTRVVTIREGDSLPLLCQEHYGSPKYYLQVARTNGLVSPLNLQVGQKIVLPPMIDDIAENYN